MSFLGRHPVVEPAMESRLEQIDVKFHEIRSDENLIFKRIHDAKAFKSKRDYQYTTCVERVISCSDDISKRIQTLGNWIGNNFKTLRRPNDYNVQQLPTRIRNCSSELETIKSLIETRHTALDDFERLSISNKSLLVSRSTPVAPRMKENVNVHSSSFSQTITSTSQVTSRTVETPSIDHGLLSLLGQKESALETTVDKLRKSEDDTSMLRSELNKAEEHNSRLRGSLSQLSNVREEHEKLKVRSKDAQLRIEGLVKELNVRAESLTQRETHERQLKAQLETCQKQINVLEKSKNATKLQDEVKALKKEVRDKSGQLNTLKNSVKDLKEELSKVKEQNVELEKDCELAAGIFAQGSGFMARHGKRGGMCGTVVTPNKRQRTESDNDEVADARTDVQAPPTHRTSSSSDRPVSVVSHSGPPRAVSAEGTTSARVPTTVPHRHDATRDRTEAEIDSDRRALEAGPLPGKPHFVNAVSIHSATRLWRFLLTI